MLARSRSEQSGKRAGHAVGAPQPREMIPFQWCQVWLCDWENKLAHGGSRAIGPVRAGSPRGPQDAVWDGGLVEEGEPEKGTDWSEVSVVTW